MKKPKIKSIPYEDFVDNESLEQMVKELNEGGANVFLGALDDVINWGRSNSLWPLTFATSCCGIEFMSLGAARYDMARFGFEVARASPRVPNVKVIVRESLLAMRQPSALNGMYSSLSKASKASFMS